MADMSGSRSGAKGTKAVVRSPAESYVWAALLILFFALLALYAGLSAFVPSVLILLAAAVIIAGLRDLIVFDGRRIIRRGVYWRVRSMLFGLPQGIGLRSVDVVESYVRRTIKRGGNYSFHQRVVFRGRGLEIALDTSVRGHIEMIRSILVRLPEAILDGRSVELRDYLCERVEVEAVAANAEIPSTEILEGSLNPDRTSRNWTGRAHRPDQAPGIESSAKASSLRTAGNRLRIAGRFVQAAEAFRRALRIDPYDARLLLDFGRCLEELSAATNDKRLRRRSMAMLRLAERRAMNEPRLLEDLADTYFRAGDPERAAQTYNKVLSLVETSFRALKGLGEIALYQGRLAHAVLNFSAASRSADHPRLRRWSAEEAEYLARLHESDEYMDVEIGRLNLLNSLTRASRASFRLGLWGLPVIAFGIAVGDHLIANIGWAVSGVAFVASAGLSVLSRFFVERIPYHIVEQNK
ncbi:MAG: tetratricopeptide repeat protein [Pyrinomonadaceae bacterium]